jgi:hypothetical protein
MNFSANNGSTVQLSLANSGVVSVLTALKNSGYVDLAAISTPTAPAAGFARLYCDTSGGKNRLMCLFNTGAAQVAAAQP